MSISVKQLQAHPGAEITGIDLRPPLPQLVVRTHPGTGHRRDMHRTK